MTCYREGEHDIPQLGVRVGLPAASRSALKLEVVEVHPAMRLQAGREVNQTCGRRDQASKDVRRQHVDLEDALESIVGDHAVIRAAQTGVLDDGVVSAHPRRSFRDGSRLGERCEVTYHGLRDDSARLIRTLVVARMKHSAVPTVDEVERGLPSDPVG